MPAYLIVNIEITDPDKYAEYIKVCPATVSKFGGKYIARGGKAEKMEGNYEPKRMVLLQFDTMEQAKAWWASEEYRIPKSIRHASSKTDMILFEGL